jgi:zinc protease
MVALVLEAGAIHDPPGKEGTAYLTGQMLLRGAGSLNQAAIAEELDYLGSALGVRVGRDVTTVSGDALTRNFDAFEKLCALLVTQPTFSDDELEKLKRQTVAELIQVRDSDSALGQRFYVRRLFEAHPYGRAAHGTEASIPTITRDDVVAFYTKHYRQGGAMVGAAGDLDAERLRGFIERTLGALPTGGTGEPPIPPAPQPKGIRVLLVDKPERTQTQVYVGHPTLAATHPDYLPLLVAHTLFGGTFTATLSQEIREKRGWSYGAYSYLSGDKHLGTFSLRFYPAVKDTVPALRLATELYQALVKEGATEEQVEFARRFLVQSHPFSIDTAERKVHELLAALLQGHPADWLDHFPERVGAVTTAEVNAAMKRHLTPDDLLVVVVATAADLEADIAAWGQALRIDKVDYRAE